MLPGISDVMQSPVLMMEGADDNDVVSNIKTLKRKALRNQQQLIGKMNEVGKSFRSRRVAGPVVANPRWMTFPLACRPCR